MFSRRPASSRKAIRRREVLVGVIEHGGVGAGQAAEQPLLVGCVLGPGPHEVVARRKAGVLRHDPERLLPLEPALALDVPAVLEHLVVAQDEVARRLVRRVAGAEGEPGQPRRVGRVGRVVGDEADGLVGQVLGQVVAAGVGPGRGDRRVVADELGRVLVGLGVHEAVEAVEAAPQRPAVERPGRPGLGQRGDVPLADHVVAIAVRPQDLRQRARRRGRSCRDSRDSRSRSWRGSRRRPSDGCARSAAPPAWSSTSPWCGSRCSAVPPPPAGRWSASRSASRSSRSRRSRRRRTARPGCSARPAWRARFGGHQGVESATVLPIFASTDADLSSPWRAG